MIVFLLGVSKVWSFIVKFKSFIFVGIILAMIFGFVSAYKERGHTIEKLKAEHADYIIKQNELALKQQIENKEFEVQNERKLKEVEYNAIIQIKAANVDADIAKSNSSRLSEQIRVANSKLSTASKETIINYTIVGTELLESCVTEYREMAKIADGHAIDVRRLSDSWIETKPKK